MARPAIEKGLIVTTDALCIVQGLSWPDIPTLIWSDGIDEPASDWFRDLIVRGGKAATTAHEYANILRPFLRYCRMQKRGWETADDELLILWRERLRRNEGVGIARANAALKTIFSFYVWAEERGYIRYRVGIYAPADLPSAMAGSSFPISAKLSFVKSRRGRTHGVWTTPLTLRDPEKGSRRHTPSETEIREIHSVVVERRHGERNSLIMSYAEETGGRRSEILQIGKSHMPSDEQLADLIERDHPWSIAVKQKGGGQKLLYVPPDLIIRTLSFIEHERGKIVIHRLNAVVGYREPDNLFLSEDTGLVLHPDSVTSIGRDAFRRAGLRNSNVHRLRARFAVRTIETLVDALFCNDHIGSHSNWSETILIKASQMMGHASSQSLRPYLTYVLNRRIQAADVTKAADLTTRIRLLKLDVDAYVHRLASEKALHQIAGKIANGRMKEAAAALRHLANETEGSAKAVRE